MKIKPLVVWLMIVANLVVRTSALAVPLDEGAAAGAAANTSARGMINQPSASTVVPGYTTTPPESALAGTPNLAPNASARLATCMANPSAPGCDAIATAITSANTPRPAIGAGDLGVAGASQIAANPSIALGSLAQYYAGCATADVPTPPARVTRACTTRNGIGNSACSNRLTVDVSHRNTCDPGKWIAETAGGDATLAVQCIPGRPESRQHFRATLGDSEPYFFDYSLAGADRFPLKVKKMGEKVDQDLGVVDISLYLVDNVCAQDRCSITAIVTEDRRYACVEEGSEGGSTCSWETPFLPIYQPCPEGQLTGDKLRDPVPCASCQTGPPRLLDPRQCYRPVGTQAMPLWPVINAVDTTGSSTTTHWYSMGQRPVIGWKPNPKYGPFPIMTLGYEQPRHITTETDSWVSNCPTATPGGRCAFTGQQRCVDGPSTRLITGVPVTRACWNFERPMTCDGAAGVDECQPLVDAGCSPVTSTCRSTNPATGACSVLDRSFSCVQSAQTVTTAANCPSNVSCVGSTCFNTTYTPDPDFARSMSMLEAAREAAIYLDTDRLEVFRGEPRSCRDRLLNNCCYTNGAGAGMTNQKVFGTGTKLVYDILMNSENREFVMQGMSALIAGGGFSGSYTAYGVTIAVNGTALPAGSTVLYASSATAGEGFVVAFDPWTLVIAIVIYIVISLASCNEGEARLAMQEGAKLCHSIGTYCSQCFRVLGRCVSCTEHTTGKCCFNSLLARLVNEQGRLQVSKGWGTPSKPDCSGFTIAQLQSLDFAAMNLTEFYASLVPTSPDLTAIQANNAGRVTTCYYGRGKCGP